MESILSAVLSYVKNFLFLGLQNILLLLFI